MVGVKLNKIKGERNWLYWSNYHKITVVDQIYYMTWLLLFSECRTCYHRRYTTNIYRSRHWCKPDR